MKKCRVLLLSFLSLFSLSSLAEAPITLDWVDLIPKQEREQAVLPPPIVSHDGEMQMQQNLLGSTRKELDGSLVKIPGFVIPLEGDDKVTTEFLLVPYFGACVHVPPPPPNQIIYVKFKEGAPLSELWDVVYVVGVLKTQVNEVDLAQTGYLLLGEKIEPYDEGDEYEEGMDW